MAKSLNIKICHLLKKLKEDSELSIDPRWILRFRFNNYLSAPGLLNDFEEKNVLFRLEQDGILKINVNDNYDISELSEEQKIKAHFEAILKAEVAHIELLDTFRWYYALHCKIPLFFDSLNRKRFWYYTNPFWLLFQLFSFLLRNKRFSLILSSILGLIGILAMDFSTIQKNYHLVSTLFSALTNSILSKS